MDRSPGRSMRAQSIIEGRWDIARARTEYIKRPRQGTGQSLLAQYREAVKTKVGERTVTLAAQVRAIDPEEFGVWSAQRFQFDPLGTG